MEIIVRNCESNPKYQEVLVDIKQINQREFHSVVAPQIAERYKLIPREVIPGIPTWFLGDNNSDFLIGLKLKEHMSEEQVQEQAQEIAPIQDPMEEAVVSEPVEAPAEVEVKEAVEVRTNFPLLDPEDSNTARLAWEKGPLNEQFVQDMKTKYQVEGDVALSVLPTGEVTFFPCKPLA